MAAPFALGRRQPDQTSPAEGAHDASLGVRQQSIARDTYAWQKKIERPRESAAKRNSARARLYNSDCRIASRSGAIPNHR